MGSTEAAVTSVGRPFVGRTADEAVRAEATETAGLERDGADSTAGEMTRPLTGAIWVRRFPVLYFQSPAVGLRPVL